MKVIIAWDGDHIGREVGRASLADDVEGLRRVSQAIDAGNKIWESWVTMNGGSIISFGGDEGRAEILAEKLAELPKIRDQYAGAVGSTVSVGVGTRLSEADRALLASKLQGGDKIILYTPEVEETIAKIEKERGQKSEADKISEAYLGKSQSKFIPAFRDRQTGKVIESPGIHNWKLVEHNFDNFESGFVDLTKKFYSREAALASLNDEEKNRIKANLPNAGYSKMPTQLVSEFVDPNDGLIVKALPGANQGAGAGFTGVSQADAPSQEKPVAEASEHSQGEAAAQMMQDKNPRQPEATASADRFEDQFHDAAKQQQDKDAGQQQAPTGDEQLKAQIVQVLQNLKTQMPVLEQVKATAPDTYQAIMGLAQAVVLMARSMNGADTQNPGPKELQDRANSQAQIEVPLPPEEGKEGKDKEKKTEKAEKEYKLMGDALIEVDPKTGKSLGKGPVNEDPVIKEEMKAEDSLDCDEYGHCWGVDAAGDYCLMCGGDRTVIEPDLKKSPVSWEPGDYGKEITSSHDVEGLKHVQTTPVNGKFVHEFVHPKHKYTVYSLTGKQEPPQKNNDTLLARLGGHKTKAGFHLDSWGVHPSAQGQGLGRALLEHAITKHGTVLAGGGKWGDAVSDMATNAIGSYKDNPKYDVYLGREGDAKDPHRISLKATKASLNPNAQPPEHHHLNLPVGSHIDPGSQATRRVGRIKVQHIESGLPAKQSWIQARAGQVLSQDGHAISARNPNGR
jgi:hypothetical protein